MTLHRPRPLAPPGDLGDRRGPAGGLGEPLGLVGQFQEIDNVPRPVEVSPAAQPEPATPTLQPVGDGQYDFSHLSLK